MAMVATFLLAMVAVVATILAYPPQPEIASS
jgi:hypothetical protein